MSGRQWDAQLGENLRQMMAARGMSQREFAARSGLSQQAVSKFVRAENGPTFYSLCAMAGALGMSASEFVREVMCG